MPYPCSHFYFDIKFGDRLYSKEKRRVGWFKNTLSSQTEKLMATINFSDYLGLKHYKKQKK